MTILRKDLTFGGLVDSIKAVDLELARQANKAVNVSLTLRNWLIGCYNVEEYERGGVDRADYGDKLMDRLSESPTKHGVSRCDRREIYRYRRFYITYPQIVEAVTPQLRIDGKTLVSRLSFSHFVELLDLEDSVKRAFYEVECIQGNWSVRELKRPD